MSNIAFTKNYTDHSNQQGYQFEFHCDKCGSGFRSTYAASTLGMATGVLHAAADIFGGFLGSAANAGEHMKDALRGKAWDDAFSSAIAEIKPKFKQCTRCSKWVCPEVCWNAKASLCKDCAPDLAEETAAAQAAALKQSVAAQIAQKIQGLDLTAGMDMSRQGAAVCPNCSAPVTGSKFCGSCGKPMQAAPSACPKCKAEIPAAAKFCPDCGSPRG
jgi:hypothetical protein